MKVDLLSFGLLLQFVLALFQFAFHLFET